MKKFIKYLIISMVLFTGCSKQSEIKVRGYRELFGIVLKTYKEQNTLINVRVYPYIDDLIRPTLFKKITYGDLKGYALYLMRNVCDINDNCVESEIFKCDLLSSDTYKSGTHQYFKNELEEECITNFLEHQIDLSSFVEKYGYVEYKYVLYNLSDHTYIDINKINGKRPTAYANYMNQLHFEINSNVVLFGEDINKPFSFIEE